MSILAENEIIHVIKKPKRLDPRSVYYEFRLFCQLSGGREVDEGTFYTGHDLSDDEAISLHDLVRRVFEENISNHAELCFDSAYQNWLYVTLEKGNSFPDTYLVGWKRLDEGRKAVA